MKSEKIAIKKALDTTKILEEQLKPFFHENAKTMVAPVQQFLENHLALAEREELNSKLTPEIIKENILKEEEATIESAKRRMDERRQRREDAKAEAEKEVIAQAKADKKGKIKEKVNVVDLGSAQSTDLKSAQSTDLGGDASKKEVDQATELSEEQKAALAEQLTDESSDEDGEELTEEEKALLAAESSDSQTGTDASAVNAEEVEKKPEKKNQTKKVTNSAQEPLI
jgi:hypothetical protein